MKIYISKYALSSGIFYINAEIRESGMACEIGGYHRCFHEEGKEWHETLEDALKRAEEIRLRKIASLKKQLAKYEKMRFDGECEVSE